VQAFPLSLGRGEEGNDKIIKKMCARLGKTRGAIGFALIFLWLLSLYQDKESNDNPISFEITPLSIVEMINHSAIKLPSPLGEGLGVRRKKEKVRSNKQ
jgi:hypothetical protein